MWCAYILRYLQIQICPLSYGGLCLQVYFQRLILYTNKLYDVGCLYFTLSPNTNLVGARVYIVHFYYLLYALILIYKLWGPVSISLFSPPNSIYKPALCFNSVCVCVCVQFVDITLFPNTNLPDALWWYRGLCL